MKAKTIAMLGIWLAGLAFSASAAIDAYEFPDEQMRDRYKELIEELRCPQCLNTNIAGSDAMIAKDLRRETHRLLLEGKSDEEILDYMHERYGDFILYEPRLNLRTVLLWFGPLVLLVIAAIALLRLVRARRGEQPALSEAERARLERLLVERNRGRDE